MVVCFSFVWLLPFSLVVLLNLVCLWMVHLDFSVLLGFFPRSFVSLLDLPFAASSAFHSCI